MREEVFHSVPELNVVLVDLGSGMTSAYDAHGVLPKTRIQYCNWHAVMAIKTYLTGKRYTSKEIKGDVVEGETIPDIIDYIWRYILSNTVDNLDVN